MQVYLNGKLTDRFTYKDMINPLGKSLTVREQLEPLYYQIKNAKNTLEPLELFLSLNPNYKIRITSFFRSWEENKRVKGSNTSGHLEGEAVDFEVINQAGQEENEKFVKFIHDRQIPFDQIILFNSKNKPTAIHLGMGGRKRGQYLLYTKAEGYRGIAYPY